MKRNSFLPLFLVVSLVIFLLFLRLSQLQIRDGKVNLALSEGNRVRSERLRPQRGLIVDERGSVLARNLPTFSIIFNPQICAGKLCPLDVLSELSNFPQIRERLEKNKTLTTPLVLSAALSRDDVLALGNLDGFPYLQVESDQVRSYPDGKLFAHVVGFLGEASASDLKEREDLFLGDFLGKEGVEKIYDRDLQGTSGLNLVEVDAEGGSKRFLSRKDPVVGKSLVLTVRKDLQEVADSALSEAEKKSDVCCGAVVVADVRTGAILSLISHPSFDPNIFADPRRESEFPELLKDKNQPFFNRAVSGNFPPGSVFKLVVAAAALTENVINLNTSLPAPGSVSLGSFVFRDWKPEGHGTINIEQALAESADTFFYQIGGGYESFKGLGPYKIAQYARLFGFGAKPLIDLPQADPGLVPDPDWKKNTQGEPWYVGNTYHLSIGQGDFLSTPLQVNQMTMIVANGGVLFKPFVLSKIVDEAGKTLFENQVSVIREKFVESAALKIVREGMKRAAIPGGTAWPFFGFTPPVGAKTGTAEAAGPGNPHAWFTVFAPFEKPEIAVTVLVENGGQGSDAAAPVAKKILEKYFEGR